MQQEPIDFKADTLKRDLQRMEDARAGISKRALWLAVVAFAGLSGTMALVAGGDAAHELRHTFGEVGAVGAVWALLIGGVWLVADFFRGKKINARIPVVLAELRKRGYDYDHTGSAWVWRGVDESAGGNA